MKQPILCAASAHSPRKSKPTAGRYRPLRRPSQAVAGRDRPLQIVADRYRPLHPAAAQAHIETRGGEVRLNSPVQEIQTNEDGSVKGLVSDGM